MKLTFGQKLMLLRKNKKLSQRQLASFLEIGATNVARYENGRIPTPDILVKLSDFFGVSIDYLLKDNFETDDDLNAIAQQLLSLPKNDRVVALNAIKGVVHSFGKMA